MASCIRHITEVSTDNAKKQVKQRVFKNRTMKRQRCEQGREIDHKRGKTG